MSSTVGWAKSASDLHTLLDEGKKIIITIVHKFQFILNDISTAYKNRTFAIIIDEAHSSQNGSLAAKMNIVISGNVYTDDDDFEDKINTIIEGKKMAQNASYFAFTATPKNKTLPDFYIPSLNRWFEIKGKPLSLNEIKKCEEFCRRLDNENIKYSVIIGSPNLCAVRVGDFFGILEYIWEWPFEKYPDNYRIQAPKELIEDEYYSRFVKGLWVVPDKTEEEVAAAAIAAGKARFEFGEKPDV